MDIIFGILLTAAGVAVVAMLIALAAYVWNDLLRGWK